MEVTKKTKIESPYDLALLCLDIYLKELKTGSQRDICTAIFTAVLLTTTRVQKQPKCTLMNEKIEKKKKICPMVYFSSLKKREILAYVTMWMKLKDTILSEISKSQKDKYYTTSLI